jgi:hypothetical protein
METKRKRLTREQKHEQAVVDLINKMFEIAGHQVTYDDIKDRKDDWYCQWEMTVEQNEEWKNWGEQYLKKVFKLNKTYAEREMAMVSLMWGLKFSNFA